MNLDDEDNENEDKDVLLPASKPRLRTSQLFLATLDRPLKLKSSGTLRKPLPETAVEM